MKKTILAGMTAMFAAAGLADSPAIEQVIVRQQWPWSTDVKVEYKLTGVDSAHPVNIGVEAYNGEIKLDASRLEQSITGARYGIFESGIGQFVIDPVKAFGNDKVALANFKVKLSLTASDANASEVVYKIFDLENTNQDGTFKCTDVTRADLKNGIYGDCATDYSQVVAGAATSLDDVLIWTGVTNYPGAKTTKLVMRKIPKGTFTMGATGGNLGANAERPHETTLTHDYYIGVFEVTQEQYRKLAGSNWNQAGFKADANPVENGATFSGYRGVVTNTIAQKLGVPCDFPTEAQWERACRAGTTSELYTGTWLSSANLNLIAWHNGNAESTTHEVGLMLPNAYGLYDMVGNVYEACRDLWIAAPGGHYSGEAVTDPVVDVSDSDEYVMRGGAYTLSNFLLTSAGRTHSPGNWTAYGFRLSFTTE